MLSTFFVNDRQNNPKTTSISSLLPYQKNLFSKRRVFPLIDFSGTTLFSRPTKFLIEDYNNNLKNNEMKNLKKLLASMVNERGEKLLNIKENTILLVGEEEKTKEPNNKIKI